VVGACGWHVGDGDRDAEHGIAVDRFAREIVGFLKVVGGALAATERQSVRRPGRVIDIPFFDMLRRIALPERPLCRPRGMPARVMQGVVRTPVVRRAGSGQRDPAARGSD